MIKTKEIKTIFKNKYIELQNNLVENDNTKRVFEHIKIIENNANYPGSVILCKFKDKFLLLNNYRYGIEDYSWELPRGYANENESLEECAIRELKEEININFTANSTIQKLGEIAINSSIIASKVVLYLIEIVNIEEIIMQEEEQIVSYKWVSLENLTQMIKTNEISDSFTISSLMFYISSR